MCISKFLSAFDIYAWLGVAFPCANEILCWQIDFVKSVQVLGEREAPNQSSKRVFLKIPPNSSLIPGELFYRMLLLIITNIPIYGELFPSPFPPATRF